MRFDLLEPQSIEEAVSALSAAPEETRVIAGGQSLLLMIRSGLVRPRRLVSLNALEELTRIALTPEGNLSIGALVTHDRILSHREFPEAAGILAQAAFRIGCTPVRNFGTLGGNLCHNEMGSDPPPALLALGASVECAGPRGRRKLPLSEFFTDFFATRLEPGEILARIEIPPQPSAVKGVYLKHTLRSGDLAVVGVAAMMALREGVCEDVRIALGGVGAVPFRATRAEGLLRHKPFEPRLVDEAAAAAAEMSDPISDAHASADYRRSMARVFVRRALGRIGKDSGVS